LQLSQPFEAEWARCRPWLQAALEHGPQTHTLDDVRRAVEVGEADFWPGRKSAVVSEFITYPRAKALNFFLLAGDPRELITGLRPAIEQWGAERGCTLFLGFGSPDRPSWGRVLKRHGYAHAWSVYVKDTR
jgi:hypothetical protein